MSNTLLPCPFCGGKAEIYRTNEHERLRFFGSCLVCGVETPRIGRTRKQVEAAWNCRYNPKPEPLTLEEIKECGGEPVWIIEHPEWGHWELSECGEDYLEDRDEAFYGMKHNDPAGRFGLHALGWLAYRYKPDYFKED